MGQPLINAPAAARCAHLLQHVAGPDAGVKAQLQGSKPAQGGQAGQPLAELFSGGGGEDGYGAQGQGAQLAQPGDPGRQGQDTVGEGHCGAGRGAGVVRKGTAYADTKKNV